MSMVSLPSSPVFDVDRLCRGVWGVLFGEEIECSRQEKALAIKEAAARAGITVEEWEAIEAGHVPESWEQLCRVGEGLGESRTAMAALVIRYAGAWERGRGLPGKVRQMYS